MNFYQSDNDPLIKAFFGSLAGTNRTHEFMATRTIGYGLCFFCWGDRDDHRHWLPYKLQELTDAHIKAECDSQPLTRGIIEPRRPHRWNKKEPQHADCVVS